MNVTLNGFCLNAIFAKLNAFFAKLNAFRLNILAYNYNKMCCLLKLVGFKDRKMSLNRSLNHDEIIEKMTYCEKIHYWLFFHT